MKNIERKFVAIIVSSLTVTLSVLEHINYVFDRLTFEVVFYHTSIWMIVIIELLFVHQLLKIKKIYERIFFRLIGSVLFISLLLLTYNLVEKLNIQLNEKVTSTYFVLLALLYSILLVDRNMYEVKA